jgi:hypothetical protein
MDDIIEVHVAETNNLNVDQIREKINTLSTTEEGISLEKAMAELKVALKENPAACSLLLPEDVGLCVAALRKMTNKGILEELSSKKTKKDKVVITQEDMDNLTMDDLL